MAQYKANDLVMIKYKRGAKLAEIVAINREHGTVLKIWNATGRKWSKEVWRPFVHIHGYATPSDLRSYCYPSPAAQGA